MDRGIRARTDERDHRRRRMARPEWTTDSAAEGCPANALQAIVHLPQATAMRELVHEPSSTISSASTSAGYPRTRAVAVKG